VAAITDSGIAKAAREVKASGKRLELADATTPGLKLRVYPSGRRHWLWAGRDRSGAVRRHGIGEYPTIGIAAARTVALSLRQLVRFSDADPTADRRKARQRGADARKGVGTLESLIDTYAARDDRPSWAAGAKRVKRVLSPILKRHLSTLSPDDIIGEMRQTNSPGSPFKADAGFVVRTLRPWLKDNPESRHLAVIKSPTKPIIRKRYLSPDELRLVLPFLDNSDKPHDRATRFLFWVAGRLNEVIEATWDEFDLEKGEWKSERDTKTNKEAGVKIDIILPKQAVEFLNRIRAKDVQPKQLVFATSKGKKLGNWDRATKRVHKATKVSGWHRHDIRRTCATTMGNNGVMPSIIEAALGHKIIYSSIAQVYNQSKYRSDVGDALQRLADFYDRLGQKE
jgi:hypothetical protein